MIMIEESEKKLLKKILGIAEVFYDDDITHGYSHARRVLALSLMIAEELKETIDGFVLATSAILHDIGRNRCREHHAICAARFSEKILEA
jgi:HD superfamily phosphodiesterase